MNIFQTVLIVVGLLICGFGVSWMYLDAWSNLYKIYEQESENEEKNEE